MKYFKLGRSVLATLLLAFLLVPTAVQAQNVDILKIYNEVSNLRNADELIKYFTDDAVFQTPGGTIQGKARLLAVFKTIDFSTPPKLSIPPRVEGNKVISRQIVAVPGQNITIEDDITYEFEGDKIKKLSVVPTPESLQKLAALQGGDAPGVPSAGAGGVAVTPENNNLLILALLASAVVIVLAVSVALILRRRTTNR
jgi:hypothetical protein